MSQAPASKTTEFVRAPEPPQGDDVKPSFPRIDISALERSVASDPIPGVHGLQDLLARRFQDNARRKATEAEPEALKPLEKKPKAKPATPGKLFSVRSPNRLVKIGAGLALVVVFGWNPLQTLLIASSVEAVVNTRVVTIRSPIDGMVESAPRSFETWTDPRAAPVVHIVDETANRGELDELRRRLGLLEDERGSIAKRITLASAGAQTLTEQSQRFLASRIRQLEARVDVQNHEVAAANARATEADAAFARAAILLKSGTTSSAQAAKMQRDKAVADEELAATNRRIGEAAEELAAARAGVFIGDSFNDRPISAQRAEDVRMKVGELNAELSAQDAKIERLRTAVSDEETRFKNRSDVSLALPPRGRIWEILTAPGENINRGQELVRVIDCASAVVSANVNETVYNGLQIGSSAKFRLATSSKEYAGTVVSLTGVASASANFAILPGALIKEAYHVTIFVPEIADGGACNVGRTGRVIFDKSAQPDGGTSDAKNSTLRPTL